MVRGDSRRLLASTFHCRAAFEKEALTSDAAGSIGRRSVQDELGSMSTPYPGLGRLRAFLSQVEVSLQSRADSNCANRAVETTALRGSFALRTGDSSSSAALDPGAQRRASRPSTGTERNRLHEPGRQRSPGSTGRKWRAEVTPDARRSFVEPRRSTSALRFQIRAPTSSRILLAR